jgi:hypothetical protein
MMLQKREDRTLVAFEQSSARFSDKAAQDFQTKQHKIFVQSSARFSNKAAQYFLTKQRKISKKIYWSTFSGK